jgi:hypothetical protein
MKIEPKSNCPLDGFKPCRQLDCAWFMKVRGNNPNTGEEIDDYGCSMAWLPVLVIESSQQQRQSVSAVVSFRNEMVNSYSMSQHVFMATLQQARPELKVIEVKS